MNHTPTIATERLILRPFAQPDVKALFAILSDKQVNTFLPMFPLENLQETAEYLQKKYLDNYTNGTGFYYAICLRTDNIPIGYVHVAGDDSHDLGYGLSEHFWHKGIVTEACKTVIEMLRETDIPYITATHDVNNPRSGQVMQNIGMKYQYSYVEQWQPKDFPVTFRMYQLNLDGQDERVYNKYRDMYPEYFIKRI